MAVTNRYCTSGEPAAGQVVGVLFDGNAPVSFSAHAFEYLSMWMQPKKVGSISTYHIFECCSVNTILQ